MHGKWTTYDSKHEITRKFTLAFAGAALTKTTHKQDYSQCMQAKCRTTPELLQRISAKSVINQPVSPRNPQHCVSGTGNNGQGVPIASV